MSKKLEAWARADLVAEVLALRAQNELLEQRNETLSKKLVEQKARFADGRKPTPEDLAKAEKAEGLFDDLLGLGKPLPPPKRPPNTRRNVDVEEYEKGYVAFEAEAVHETDLALLVEVGGEKCWFPKASIHRDSEVNAPGDEGSLIVLERLAEEKGLL